MAILGMELPFFVHICMVRYWFSLVLVLMVFLSCQKEKVIETVLPSSNFYNLPLLKNAHVLNHVIIQQVASDSVKIIKNDSVTVKIDSNLHYVIYDFLKISEFGSPFVSLWFDSNYPFKKLNEIIVELRKIRLLKIVFAIQSEKGISIRFGPISQNEEVYFAPETQVLFGSIPRPPGIDMETLLFSDSTLLIRVDLGELKVLNKGEQVLDLYSFILKHKEVVCLYELNKMNVYQDYIMILDEVLSNYRKVRAFKIGENKHSERAIKQIYRVHFRSLN